MDNLTNNYDPFDDAGSYDEYNSSLQSYYDSQTLPYAAYEASTTKYNFNYQLQNKYVPQNTMFNSLLQNRSNNHRKIDTMFRFYRISNTLNVNNPDRIYRMFLSRLKSRKRLESSSFSLELVVAALFYIDQRNNSPCNYTLRDILSRIPNCKVSLKKFSGIISKISKEAGINKLSTIYDKSVIGNMLDQLRMFCLQNTGTSKEPLTPSCTTTVLMNMDEFGDLNSMINSDTDNSNLSVISGSNRFQKNSKNANTDRIKYKLIHKLLCSNYDRIEKLSLKLLKLLDDQFSCPEDILAPSNRFLFQCKKTFISCTIFIVLSAMKIPVTSTLVCKCMNVARASFYRNHRKLMSRLSLLMKIGEKSKDDKKNTLFKSILLLGQENTDVLNLQHCNQYKNGGSDTCELSKNNIDFDYTYVNKSLNIGKLTYGKSLRCLDFLNYEFDFSKNTNKDTHINPVYYDRTTKKYTCIYKSNGKKRKKSFSVKLYGNEGAIRLATEFSRSLSHKG